MSFSWFTAPDDPERTGSGAAIVTWALAAFWVLLIGFGFVSIANPAWLKELSDPGRHTEALQMREKGDVFLIRGNPNYAVQLYLDALSIQPDMVSARVNLGIAYAQMGMFDEAERTFLEGLKLEPAKEYVIRYNLASMYSDFGDTNSALKMYYQTVKSAPYPYFTYREIGAIYFNQEDWRSAIYYFQKAFEKRLTIQNAYAGMLEEELRSWPDDPDIREDIQKEIDRGITSQRLAVYDSTVFNQILGKDREISSLQSYLGYANAMVGNLDIAIAHFRFALNIWPDNRNARRNLDMALQKREILRKN